jgi:CHAT domain-containing protein
VLSACNTASDHKPGAEALSGLARAFYAGTRFLLVSNSVVETASIFKLMIGTFEALVADPTLSHAEAPQKSMLSMVQSQQQPEWVEPKFWAALVVVGAPAKPQLCGPRDIRGSGRGKGARYFPEMPQL